MLLVACNESAVVVPGLGDKIKYVVRVGTPMKRGEYAGPGIFFVLFIVAFALTLLQSGDERGLQVVGDVFYVLFSGIAAVMGFFALRRFNRSTLLGKTLLFVEIAVVLEFIAGFVWMVYQEVFGIIDPFPSLADIPWVLFYVAAIIAFVYPLRKVAQRMTAKHVAVWVVVAIALCAIVFNTIIVPIISDVESTFWLKVLSAVYPIGGVLLLLVAFALFLLLRNTALGPSFLVFVLAIASYGVADLLFTYTEYAGTYQTGSFIDVLYYLAQLMFAYGFYLQIETSRNAE